MWPRLSHPSRARSRCALTEPEHRSIERANAGTRERKRATDNTLIGNTQASRQRHVSVTRASRLTETGRLIRQPHKEEERSREQRKKLEHRIVDSSGTARRVL